MIFKLSDNQPIDTMKADYCVVVRAVTLSEQTLFDLPFWPDMFDCKDYEPGRQLYVLCYSVCSMPVLRSQAVYMSASQSLLLLVTATYTLALSCALLCHMNHFMSWLQSNLTQPNTLSWPKHFCYWAKISTGHLIFEQKSWTHCIIKGQNASMTCVCFSKLTAQWP